MNTTTSEQRVAEPDDCVFLTDRWGDWNLDTRESAEREAVRAALLPLMFDELTFIAERGGVAGIMAEFELDDDVVPNADMLAMPAMLVTTFPGAQPYWTNGDHVFNSRHALRVFVPMEVATASMIESICRIAFERLFGEVL